MATKEILTEDVINLIENAQTFKAIATVDEEGHPHITQRDLTMLDDGTLAYGEPFESSYLNSDMVRSIWFNQSISIFLQQNNHSFEIKGRPVRYVIEGPLYNKFYLEEKEKHKSDGDLAGVWIIEPQEIRNESYSTRRKEEIEKHPHFQHLDRILERIT